MTEEIDDTPEGYEIQHWNNPDQWIVYKNQSICKCCGHDASAYMRAISPSGGFPTLAAAKDWLKAHLTPAPVCELVKPKPQPPREDARDALLMAIARQLLSPSTVNQGVLYNALTDMEQFA